MRVVFGVLSLLMALAVAGVVVKNQLAALSGAAIGVPGSAAVAVPATTPAAAQRPQSAQIQSQVKQSLEAAMQQARPVPDDK